MSLGEATKVIDDFSDVSSEFEVVVDEDDPFYGQLFTDEYEAKPSDDH